MQGSRIVFALFAVASLSMAFALGPQTKSKPSKVPYSTIAPIIKGCVGCHSGAHPKHALDLSTYAKVMKGDKEGKVVVAGNPGASRLSKAVHRKGAAPMPPMGALSKGDVAKIDAWIKAGAKDK